MDGILLPAGIDGSIVVNTIVAEYADLDVVHHTPERFKFFSDLWFKRKFRIIEKLYETTQLEYDPIENYRRYEEGRENNDDTEERSTGRITNNNRDQSSVSTVNSDAESIGQVSAYNSDLFVNDSKTNSTNDTTDKLTDQVITKDEMAEEESIGNRREKNYHSLAHGNIGVTTSQQMVEQERSVSQFDIYQWIADHWAQDNLVMVWG